MVYCYFCEKSFNHMNAFLTHHRWHHNGMTTKEYYDKYLKQKDEGICQTPTCENECTFYSLSKGYNKHCSRECTQKDPEIIKKMLRSKNMYGYYNNNRKKAEETCLKKYGVKNVSQIEEVKEKKKETCLENNGYEYWVGTKEHKEWMNNGGAAYCNRFIKNPSKPQIELYNKILKLCPYAILNYPSCGYSIDIAIPFLNIAIEYDGSYWHNTEYDDYRQKKLEQEGWKFLRYVDEIPDQDKIMKDIGEIL